MFRITNSPKRNSLEAKYPMHKCATTVFIRVAVAILETHRTQLSQSHTVAIRRWNTFATPEYYFRFVVTSAENDLKQSQCVENYVFNLLGHTINSTEAYCPVVPLSSRFGVFPVRPSTLFFDEFRLSYALLVVSKRFPRWRQQTE